MPCLKCKKTAANGIKTKAAVQSEAVKCPKRQIKACLLYRLLFYPSTLYETSFLPYTTYKILYILIVESPLKKSKLPLLPCEVRPVRGQSVRSDLAFICRLDKPSAISQRGAD